MADFSLIKNYLEKNNLSYFTFFPKSEKPVKAVIRHLPHNTSAEDISDCLVSLHKECLEEGKASSTQTCCRCLQLPALETR
jgi:hypothetical protein